MRVAVFTAQADIVDSPWWPILIEMPGLEGVLLCQKVQHLTASDALRRFRRNVRRHGPLFIPYRAGLLAMAMVRRVFRPRGTATRPEIGAAVEHLEVSDLHAPETLARVRAFGADVGVSIGAPILRATLFRLPRRGTINLHLGKVPDFRGAPPAFWELVKGASTVGATVHWMDDTLDTGAVIAAGEAPIYSTDRVADVEERVTELGTIVLRDALDAIASGDATGRVQTAGGATHRFPTLHQRMALASRLGWRRWRTRLAPRRVIKTGAMAVALFAYRPARDALRTLMRRHPVRAFNFHRVTTLCRDGMTITPRAFAECMRYLARTHDIVSLERAVELVRSGARLSRPAAVVTFDDAYRSVFKHALPTLAALQVPATCFVSTDLVGTDRRFDHDDPCVMRRYFDVMDWGELATLKTAGWSFGTHTANHVRLSESSGATLVREIEAPIAALREQLGVSAQVLAYPFGGRGDISDVALDAVRRAGQSTVFSNFGGENETGSTEFVLRRFDVGGDHEPLAWRCMVRGIDLRRWKRLWPA